MLLVVNRDLRNGFYNKLHDYENAVEKRIRRLGTPLRRNILSHPEAVIKQAIETILPTLPETVGYRTLTGILRGKGYVHVVPRDTVMSFLREIDPDGTQMRRRRRIQRRIYHSLGPNHIWHVDGYDKLKPYGFAIHGCIDGFSRKLMWMSVGPSNNDPAIVALNFVQCVHDLNGCPLILQADPGTENITMGALQCVFRHDANDDFSGLNSFRVTRSVFNQRIEAWWSLFRRRKSQWWMNFFKDLEIMGLFHRGNAIETYCLRYCIMPLLQHELDTIVEEWNSHYISHSRLAECPNGRPDILYSLDGIECLQPVSEDDIALGLSTTNAGSRSGSPQFDHLAEYAFTRNDLTNARNWIDAMNNYVKLLSLPFVQGFNE